MSNDDFIAAVQNEMQAIGNSGVQNVGDQFAIWFCEAILGEDQDDARDIYHIGGAGDHKVDIGIADEDHETVIVAQCKYASSPLSTVYSADLPASVADASIRLEKMPDAGSNKRKQFAKAYNEIDEEDKPKRRLAVGFGYFSEDAQAYAQKFAIELYDFDRIKGLYEIASQPSEGSAPSSITFNIDLSKDTIRRSLKAPQAREIITIIQAGDIYDAVKEHQHKLFEKNLRYKLQQASRTRIAGEIEQTLREEPGSLLLLNNGLTIVCSKALSADGKLILSHPQIVNGCQSSWAIYGALRSLPEPERASRRAAEILVRIVESPDQSLSDRIARATNQQNAIAERDLKANDANQRLIAESFAKLPKPVFFERKDGELRALKKSAFERYTVKTGSGGRPVMRTMNNTTAGQIYLAVLGRPYFSKQNKKLIFANYYSSIFGISNADRFKDLGEPSDFAHVGSGANAFRDEVLFGFAVFQLVEALAAIYQDKLNLYGDVGELSDLQKSARSHLVDTSGYLKLWQYLAIACFVETCVLWAHRRKVSIAQIQMELLGDDIDRFFANVKQRKALFNMETDLDHGFILSEEDPSDEFRCFAAWFVAFTKHMDFLVSQHLSGKPTTFRWNAFIDQRTDTFKDMRAWITKQYNLGGNAWKGLFPL